RYETALAYRDERRAAGAAEPDGPLDFVLMYLANLHGEGLAIYPTHRVVMGHRELTPEVLRAFDTREVAGTPAQVAVELDAIPAATVAFAVWRGSGTPALVCTLADRSAVMLAMQGAA